MGVRSLVRSVRPSRLAVFAAIVAVTLTVAAYEGSAHGHLPAPGGWHDTTPHGTCSHEEGLKPCSICHLAHQTSSLPVVLRALAGPLRLTAPRIVERTVPAPATRARDDSPRAPPRTVSC